MSNKTDEIVRDEGKLLDDIIESYNSKADPVADIFGPGIKSHPREWEKVIKNLKDEAVEIIYKDGEGLAYTPGVSRGKKGQIILNKQASYSALLHEYEHFLFDKKNRFLGFEGVYNPNIRTQSEIICYSKEINFIKKNGNDIKTIERLKENLKEEVADFSNRIGPPTDKKIISLLEKILKE